MPWQFYVALVSAGLLLTMAILCWRQIRIIATRPYVLALVLAALWCVMTSADISIADIDQKRLLFQLRFVFLPFLPLLIFECVYRYTRGKRFLTNGLLVASLLIPVITAGLAITDQFHNLLATEFFVEKTGGFPVLRYQIGPWQLVYMTFATLLGTFSISLLAIHAWKAPAWARRGDFIMFFGGLMPFAVNALYFLGYSPTTGFNYTPLVLSVASWLILWALIGSRMGNLAPVARSVLVEHLKEGLLVLDSDGQILDINGSACKMLGFRQTFALGYPASRILAPWPDLLRLLEGPPLRGVAVKIHSNAAHECSILAVPEDAEQPDARIVLLRDITEQKRTEDELKEARDAAEAADRAKGRFLATMSHEIRTPMNGVIGFLDLLKRTEINDEQKEYIELITESSQSLLVILNDVLDYSKIEAGRVDLEDRPFSLRGLIERICTLQLPAARLKGLELQWSIASGIPQEVSGDSVRLGQILTNLLSNAIKFTSKGSVHIRVEPRSGDSLAIEVEDTGIGISEEQQERLFQPFAQADSSTSRHFGGTGLGLVISQGLSQLMGGQISLKSTMGRGSIFTCEVRLPAANVKTPDLTYGVEAGRA